MPWAWSAVVALLLVAGCSRQMSGTYASPDGLASLDFRRGGRVYVTFGESTFIGEYELDGDRVIVSGPGGAQVCTLEGEALEGFGMTFDKEEVTKE